MDTKAFILFAFGFGTCDTKIDDICEGFDIRLRSEDIEEAAEEAVNGYGIGNLQNDIIRVLYERVKHEAMEAYGIDSGRFSYFCNAGDSNLWLDNEIVSSWKDIEEHVPHCPECGKPLTTGEVYTGDDGCMYVGCCEECGCENARI